MAAKKKSKTELEDARNEELRAALVGFMKLLIRNQPESLEKMMFLLEHYSQFLWLTKVPIFDLLKVISLSDVIKISKEAE